MDNVSAYCTEISQYQDNCFPKVVVIVNIGNFIDKYHESLFSVCKSSSFFCIIIFFLFSFLFLFYFFHFRCVDLDSTISIPHTDVTFLDANHCPGAVLLLFKIKENINSENKIIENKIVENKKSEKNIGKYFLHTGDMRFHKKMKNYKAFENIKIEKIFLDTTYAHPKHKVSKN